MNFDLVAPVITSILSDFHYIIKLHSDIIGRTFKIKKQSVSKICGLMPAVKIQIQNHYLHIIFCDYI